MCSVVGPEQFLEVFTDDKNEWVYYIVNFTYDPYTIWEDVINYVRIIEMDEQVKYDCYLSCLRKCYK